MKKRTAPAALIKVMNVSYELADIIGTKKASRPQAIKGLWAYIKKNNLQDPTQRQYINLSIGQERFRCEFIPKLTKMAKEDKI